MDKTSAKNDLAASAANVDYGANGPNNLRRSDRMSRCGYRKGKALAAITSYGTRAIALAAVGLSALVGATVASSGTTRSTKPPTIPQLIAQSKKESGLVFYGNPPTANFKVLVEKFNKRYPWIKVTSYDLDDNTIFSKYASEAAQGVRTADALIASAPNLWIYASRKGYAMNYTPFGLSTFPKFVKQFKGIFVMSPDPAVIVYNKAQVKAPTSVTQIANDAGSYRKVTGYTVENTFGYTGLWGYVQKKGWSNFQKIGHRLTPTSGVASQIQLVAQGGAQAAYLTSPTARFRIASDPNLQKLLDWRYVKDAEPLIPRGIAITRKASSPASAKLFLNFVFSKAGQQAICDAGFTAYRKGFKPSGGCRNTLADVYKNVKAKNVILVPFSQKFVNDRPKFAARWHKIFG
jgi:iron(III) transport system substrate-binding protein